VVLFQSGLNTQIQFNDNGVFGANVSFTFDKTNNDLVLGGTDTGIILKQLQMNQQHQQLEIFKYMQKCGKGVLKVKGPSGLDFPLQTAFWQNNITIWNTTNTINGSWTGTIGSGVGTYSTGLPSTTSVYTSVKRGRYSNVVTTLNQVLGQEILKQCICVVLLLVKVGFSFILDGFDSWTNGGRFFAGMHTATTVISAEPSALNNTVGFVLIQLIMD
jgi:hypothetical protein